MPAIQTIYLWLGCHPEFMAQYAQAREDQADTLADEIIDIADDSSHDTITDPETGEERANSEWINRSRLRVDARKWVAAKLKPRKYGDKLITENTTIRLDFEQLQDDQLRQYLTRIIGEVAALGHAGNGTTIDGTETSGSGDIAAPLQTLPKTI